MRRVKLRKIDPTTLKNHTLAHLIPEMRGNEWRDFYADVALRGIKVPLEILADGTIVDGRHRLRAALELGLREVPVVDASLSGDSPEVYMLKAAVLRRHLTDDQRAAMAALWVAENKAPRGQASPNYGKSPPRGGEMDTSAALLTVLAPELLFGKANRILNPKYSSISAALIGTKC